MNISNCTNEYDQYIVLTHRTYAVEFQELLMSLSTHPVEHLQFHKFGTTGDVLVVWNNNVVSTIGVYRNGTFFLASSNTNGGGTVTAFTFATTGDKPVNGKWS